MAKDQRGNGTAKDGSRSAMTSDYGQRAAVAINALVPGRGRDKALARILECSPRLVRYLRRGECWTLRRLNQASRAIQDFDAYLASPDLLNQRLDAMQAELAAFRRHLRGEDDES